MNVVITVIEFILVMLVNAGFVTLMCQRIDSIVHNQLRLCCNNYEAYKKLPSLWAMTMRIWIPVDKFFTDAEQGTKELDK